MKCYFCGRDVSDAENQFVQKVMMVYVGEVCDSDLHTAVAENAFVHMSGATLSNLDEWGNVVVCSRDFVREIAQTLPAGG